MMDVMAGWREEEREQHTELGLEYRMLYERYKAEQEGTALLPLLYYFIRAQTGCYLVFELETHKLCTTARIWSGLFRNWG